MIKKFISVLLIVGIIWGQAYRKQPIRLSNDDEVIVIKPKTILKINGKEASYDGLDISNRIASFTLKNNNLSKDYYFSEINKIHLIKKDMFLGLSNTYSFKYAFTGFKKSLYISTIISGIVSTFFLNRDTTDQSSSEWEISKNESSFLYFVILTPFVGGLIGGTIGAFKPEPSFDKPLKLGKDGWQIVN